MAISEKAIQNAGNYFGAGVGAVIAALGVLGGCFVVEAGYHMYLDNMHTQGFDSLDLVLRTIVAAAVPTVAGGGYGYGLIKRTIGS